MLVRLGVHPRVGEIRQFQRNVYSSERCLYPLQSIHRLNSVGNRYKEFKWRRCFSELRVNSRNVWRSPAATQTGIFPSGRKQPQLQIPAFIISLTIRQTLTEGIADQLGQCIRGGMTAVLLAEDLPEKDSISAGELYEAAVRLKEILRDRADLFIAGRNDVAEAVGANGVILTDDSIPLAVARQLLREKYFLLGKSATTPEEVQLTASEGASFIFMQRDGSTHTAAEIQRARDMQRGGQIPVIPVINRIDRSNPSRLQQLMTSGIDGVCIPIDLIGGLGSICDRRVKESDVEVATRAALRSMEMGTQLQSPVTTTPSKIEDKAKLSPKRLLLTEGRERMLQREKKLLVSCLDVLQRVSPEIEERSLLEAAIKQLDELFLLVVVGEYNSGKSSVINALLGSRYLDEGILPTTNEICVLRFADDAPTVTVLPDGIVERKLPASLLQEINIVDTPGTNVVLDRQQRLTEEYVPRADMVLFVLSCDRPFTESEVRFLEYIRKWGKKVIFVVNKIDILSGNKDVESVKAFVSQNARRLLNLTEAFVWPVSARRALDAKLALGNSSFGGMYPDMASMQLERDERWRTSRFASMERFVADFFSGKSGAASAESLRLKLQTPLYVADALLDASRRQLKNERFAAEKDVAAAKAVSIQLSQFETEMRKDGRIQQQSIQKLLEKVAARAEAFVDETLLVSNFFTLKGYLTEGTGKEQSQVTRGFAATVLGNASSDLIDIMEQQSSWAKRNCMNQLNNYRSFAENCARQFDRSLDDIMRTADTEAKSSPNKQTTAKSSTMAVDQTREERLTDQELTTAVLQKRVAMDVIIPRAIENPTIGIDLCEQIVESEIRDAVNFTGGTALAAIGVGFVLTLILPTTAEDVLALSISFLIGYVALLNLPLRRGEIKSRIRKLTASVGSEMDKLLEKRLTCALNDTHNQVQLMIQPLELLFQNELKRVTANEKERAEVDTQLQSLKTEILNIE